LKQLENLFIFTVSSDHIRYGLSLVPRAKDSSARLAIFIGLGCRLSLGAEIGEFLSVKGEGISSVLQVIDVPWSAPIGGAEFLPRNILEGARVGRRNVSNHPPIFLNRAVKKK
jgi:hypothetical protein